MLTHLVILLSLVAAAEEPAVVADPRIEISRLQAADRLEEALEAVEGLVEVESEYPVEGVDYLRGHLLTRLRRLQDAVATYATLVGTESPLAAHARLRVAELQLELGFSPAAAALATEVLASSPRPELIDGTLRLLERTIGRGGDCRLLERIASVRLPTSQDRRLALLRAQCLLVRDPAAGRAALAGLLQEEHKDLTGLRTADLLQASLDGARSHPYRSLLADAFHHHRRFDRSVPLLRSELSAFRSPIRTDEEFERHFRLVRGQFRQERFVTAAQGYGQIAERSTHERHRARALFHRARAEELADRWRESKSSYLQVFRVDERGPLAGVSLLGALRLHARSAEKSEARQLYEQLGSSSQFRDERVMGAIFLASSSLSKTRVEGVDAWLDAAEDGGRDAVTHYWRGRLAELEGEPEKAVEAYLEALEDDYFHPVAQEALRRLDRSDLRVYALRLGRRLARSGRNPLATWILLGSQSEDGLAAREQLERELARRSRTGSIAPTAAVPTEDWPLWRADLVTADEILLSLGIWSEAGRAVSRHFPVEQPNLAFTAALNLQRAGRTRDALLIAESLAKRIPRGTPDPLVPAVFRRSLYPFAYRFLIEQTARNFQVDPLLLAAIIREESRFDPEAASYAGARGLTQFILPTAERLAPSVGLEELTPIDLERPEVAVALAGAYLQELSTRFDRRPERILAAYNAGEAQAEVWGDYCHSRDPAEYITKIGFRQTREYVVKVLRSYAHYRDLYPESIFP